MATLRLCTIGFTKKSAATFFTLLKNHGVGCLIDIRLHPNGQLAGFARQDDLAYFLAYLADCDYRYLPELAPDATLLSTYRADHDWVTYARQFEALMDARNIPQALDRSLFTARTCCLLCSEATPEQCHRRLVAERLQHHWPDVVIEHLV